PVMTGNPAGAGGWAAPCVVCRCRPCGCAFGGVTTQAVPRGSSVAPAHPEPWLERPGSDSAKGCDVVVRDTGLAQASPGGAYLDVAARPTEAWGPTKREADGTFVTTDNHDAPDENDDAFLDPVAGHGTFIATLIARLARGTRVRVGRVLETTGEGNDADV